MLEEYVIEAAGERARTGAEAVRSGTHDSNGGGGGGSGDGGDGGGGGGGDGVGDSRGSGGNGAGRGCVALDELPVSLDDL
eukprot:4595860-Pleurochrysis_carterae.AAC.1